MKRQYSVAQVVLDNQATWADPEFDDGVLPESFLNDRHTFYPDGVFKPLLDVIELSKENRPIFPGSPMDKVSGRGLLGKWGANFAADPLFVCYKVKWFVPRPYLLVVKREDTKQWALPGGMLDSSDRDFNATALREIQEEGVVISPEFLNELRSLAITLYRGINWKDPRNTFHAWMETQVMLYILPAHITDTLILRPAPGETEDSKWLDISCSDISLLYADHGHYVDLAKKKIGVITYRTKGLTFLSVNYIWHRTMTRAFLVFFLLSILVLLHFLHEHTLQMPQKMTTKSLNSDDSDDFVVQDVIHSEM